MDNSKKENNIKPLFKYIGGKTWLRDKLRESVSYILKAKQFNSYCEPFAGGLGSFLSVYDILEEHKLKNIYLSDINKNLVFTYECIKDKPNLLIEQFTQIEEQFVNLVPINWNKNSNKEDIKKNLKDSCEYFAQIKKDFNKAKDIVDITQSARLIFLQKHSFNGVYRENSKGEYNTPFNWSGNNMLSTFESKVLELNKIFNKFNLCIECKGFDEVSYNDTTLYYLDPPYLNDNISENKYNKEQFKLETQIDLINKISNSTFIYSNHSSQLLIDKLNQLDGCNLEFISRKNIMSPSNASRSIEKLELLAIRK